MAEVKTSYEERDIYYYFLKCRGNYTNTGFRFPKKPFPEYIKTKPEVVRENLTKITVRFNTMWCHVNPEGYFDVGFRLFDKGFYFNKFFEPSILTRYTREKNFAELSDESIKNKTKQSILWIKKNIKEDSELKNIADYFHKKQGYIPIFVSHYMKDQVNDMVLAYVWMNYKGWIANIDSGIQETYLRHFKIKIYKTISYLTEHVDILSIIQKSFKMMG